MPTFLGAHNARIDAARDLLTKKGRRQQGRFSFEGATLLREARDAGAHVEALYVTKASYEATPLIAECERDGTSVYVVDDRAMKRISDVETPAGILAVAPIRFTPLEDIFWSPGVVLLLADVNDPGNVGTLLRTAEAFGVAGVVMGSLGAEPHLPKVVRSAMGAVFRLRLAVAEPADLQGRLDAWDVVGLSADGEPLHALPWGERTVVTVGNERHGLGRWEPFCARLGAIPMSGHAESLNAAVAGSIALYEATKPRSG